MQKDSAQAKISLKVVGGLLFFDSPCIEYKRLNLCLVYSPNCSYSLLHDFLCGVYIAHKYMVNC